MMLIWMGYAIAIGVFIRAAAMVADRGARALRLPTRVFWAVACVATLGWPAAAYVVVSRRPAVSTHWYGPIGGADANTPIPARSHAPAVPSRWSALLARASAAESIASRADRPVLAAWMLVSLVLLGRLVWSIGRLRARRREWRASKLDGTGVLISPDIGPAVVGLRSMQIVIPQWLLELDEPLRAVVLRHENEHRRAGDPLLLFASAVACALAPWNLALWWHARRLRLAVEIDCDARVLRHEPRVDRYGALLMAIAQRRAADLPIAAAALTEPISDLERRIEAMTMPSKRSRIVGLICGGAVVVTIAFACATPVPDTIVGPARSASTAPASQVYFEFQVDTPVQVAHGTTPPAYPTALRAGSVEGRVLVSFVVDEHGKFDSWTFKVVKSTNDAFTAAVRAHMPEMSFTPAVLHGVKVAQLVQMPFVFSLTPDHVQARVGSIKYDPSPSADSVNATDAPHGPPGNVYLEFQVERQVTPASGTTAPAYPAALRAARIEGNVLASFVVDEQGDVDTSTFQKIKSTNDAFTAAVREHLLHMKFVPAMRHGVPVAQLVQMPFIFRLDQ